ncbi:UNVERIFIED_CONTAM: hypothetical protein GTU68_004902 [Idotea baltica]|nr:hypothetical protein [Idotea baltica]
MLLRLLKLQLLKYIYQMFMLERSFDIILIFLLMQPE